MKKDLSSFLGLAKVWNAARSYVSNYDLERTLGKSIKKIRTDVDAYHEAQQDHPELPDLIHRRLETGQPIPVPASALRQLDHFRMDRTVLQQAPGVVVTSAQFGATIHKDFWKALKVYAEYRGFPLAVLPIKYGPVHFINGHYTSTFPKELEGHVVFEDVMLGKDQIQLNVMRMRPTLGRFLTDEVCEIGGMISQVFAAPNVELEHRTLVDEGNPYPKACMTTGAVSIPNYSMDKLGQQDRAGELATARHQHAATVIEFDGNVFHFRQLMADEKGNFYDIDPINGGARWFTSKGHEHRPDAVEALVCGDWHTGKTCPVVRKTTFGPGSMAEALRPKNVVLHDFIDGDSVSHYEEKQASRRAWKAQQMFDSMEEELKNGVVEVNWIQSCVPSAKIHLVASNHPEFLTEYVEKLKWAKDNINLKFGAIMFSWMVGDLFEKNPKKVEAVASDPVILYFRKHAPHINTMERTDKLLLGKIPSLLSMHGDIGPRGAPTRSIKEFAKYNINVTLGHNHTGTILGRVWRVGTSTPRMQFYVTTPNTQWTNTHGPVFENGQRMLLNIIKGKWHGYNVKPSKKKAA
jgi:hypothetical protein